MLIGRYANWTLNENLHFDTVTLKTLGSKLRRFVAMLLCPYPIPQADLDQLM